MLRKRLLFLLLLVSAMTWAQDRPREYTPSPVVGTAWNAPGNANPFIPGYFADPTIRQFGDTYYLYATTDGTGNGYGPAQVWVSKDFVNWRNMVMNWPTTEVVWAPDVVQQPDGTFRYYYCEPCVISIGESTSPVGPWHNILGQEHAVMVPDRYIHNVITLDPQLFRDDDGSEYLYFTTWGIYKGFGCGVAKLAPGSATVPATVSAPVSATVSHGSSRLTTATVSHGSSRLTVENRVEPLQQPSTVENRVEPRQQNSTVENRGEPRPPYRTDARRWREDTPFPIAADTFFTEKRLIPNTELKDIFEAPFVFKRNGIYYFTYSSGSCHTDTYRVQYAVSKTGPMGPFEYKGELLTTNEDETVHGPGHHSIIEVGGRYYIVYHRHNNPKSVHGFNRQVCIDELKFDEQGNILPVIPTHNAQGVFPLITHPSPLTPHPSPLTTHPSPLTNNNLAYGATVTASSYYDEWFKPEYAVDDNNATLWKAANTNWGRGRHQDEWLQIDLGKARKFTEVWTQFEYATFFYQYKIETSLDGQTWMLYADRTGNTLQGSPMTDKGKAKARYIRITITDTQKNGHIPAIWNVKVWQKAPELPPLLTSEEEQGGGVYPGMHQKDVEAGERLTDKSVIIFDAARLAKDAKQPFDITEIDTYSKDSSRPSMKFTANKPIRMRVKDGKWALFLNGTQSLRSELPLPKDYRYNAPYTIMASVMSTKVGPVSTVASLSTSRADLATTEFRLGTDPATGLLNHNGSFESCGAPQDIKAGEGKWQLWVITYDGWMERAYVDGRLVREQNNFLMVRPEGHITIGADGSGANNFMGYINMIAIAPVATPAADIQEMYKMLSQVPAVPSLGDDDFEEIDPDSKFVLSPDAKAVFEKHEEFTLSAPDGAFNDDPLQHGATVYQEVEGDFVVMCTLSDMEGLATHSVKGYNEGGILIADGTTYYQLGAFPLYNCGNMFTVLSSRGRPQFPNYKGYDLDRYMQFERRGNQLFARTSADGKTWSNMPGSPVDIKGQTLRIGAYQTTYTDQPSWVKLRDFVIYQ